MPSKRSRLLVEIEAEALEVLVPVGELDGDLDPRVDRPGRLENEVLRGLIHQVEAELRPAAVALRRDVGGVLGRDEEEVVEDDLVEVPRGELG